MRKRHPLPFARCCPAIWPLLRKPWSIHYVRQHRAVRPRQRGGHSRSVGYKDAVFMSGLMHRPVSHSAAPARTLRFTCWNPDMKYRAFVMSKDRLGAAISTRPTHSRRTC
jgi:hypothetical protein